MLDVFYTFAQTYTYTAIDPTTQESSQQSAWYIMDEVGTAIAHADTPNSRVLPFIYLKPTTINGTQHLIPTPYSLLIPIKDIPNGEAITRDIVPVDLQQQSAIRTAYLAAFFPPNDLSAFHHALHVIHFDLLFISCF